MRRGPKKRRVNQVDRVTVREVCAALGITPDTPEGLRPPDAIMLRGRPVRVQLVGHRWNGANYTHWFLRCGDCGRQALHLYPVTDPTPTRTHSCRECGKLVYQSTHGR